MDILNRHYTAQEVADVVGTSAKNIANWADRDLFLAINRDKVGRGVPRLYTWNTLMQVVCASAIMELGFSSPQEAFKAGMHFAHIGEAKSGWVGDPDTGKIERFPGLPFHHMRGVTMLYLARERSAVLLHRIFNKEPYGRGYYRLRDRLHGSRAYITLNVSELFKEVCARLEVDYRIVLDEAYKGHDDAVNWQRPGEGN